MSDPLGSSRVSSQKQNRDDVVGAQNGQYHATAELSPGYGGGPGRDVTIWYQSQSLVENVPTKTSAPKGVDCNIPHRPGEGSLNVYSHPYLARNREGMVSPKRTISCYNGGAGSGSGLPQAEI